MNSKMKIFDPCKKFYYNFGSIKSCINLALNYEHNYHSVVLEFIKF